MNLQHSLQEEMARHAPLYGAGLEELSMKELETISHIHEEGLRQIHTIRQSRGAGGPSLVGAHSLPQVHGVFATTTVPMPIGLPPSINPNGLGNQGNGHVGDTTGPWFNPS